MENNIQDCCKLIIAGGYDERLDENVKHFQELTNLSIQLNIQKNVEFLKNITNEQRI